MKKAKKATKREDRILRNREVLAYLLANNPCCDCGESDPLVLDFDHVRGEKKRNVSEMSFRNVSATSFLNEIAKCEIRCANCHRRATRRRRACLGNGTPISLQQAAGRIGFPESVLEEWATSGLNGGVLRTENVDGTVKTTYELVRDLFRKQLFHGGKLLSTKRANEMFSAYSGHADHSHLAEVRRVGSLAHQAASMIGPIKRRKTALEKQMGY